MQSSKQGGETKRNEESTDRMRSAEIEGEWKKEPSNKPADDDEWPVQISQHVK